jgi:ribosomal protein S18 acetylase RimI-like enzyme
MKLQITETPVGDLMAYSAVPIAFQVRSRFRLQLVEQGLGGIRLVEEVVSPPYVRDYDEEKGEGPTRWLKRWDLSNWGAIAAFEGNERVGGAVLAWRTPNVNMLDGRDDRAALWDLRVRPDARGRGIGRELFRAAVGWARRRECTLLKIETQSINVPACRLYASEGCTLAVINSLARDPDEVQLIWQYTL